MNEELDYMSLLEDDLAEDYVPLKAPFAWAGGKSRSIPELLKVLPRERMYVEPFGGSGAVLLSRAPVQTEVFNDRFSAIVDFYKCLKDPALLDQLIDRLQLALYSREEWQMCRDTWVRCTDPLERSARWYTMLEYSFSNMGRNIGRTGTSRSRIAGKLRNKLKLFPAIHERIQSVFLENCSWECMFRDYNHEEAVVYCDPPYLDTDQSMYSGSRWTLENQVSLLRTIFAHKGFVALSGYPNKTTDAMPWDDVIEWDVKVSVKGTHNKHDQSNRRLDAREVLYIKEAY